METPRSNKRKRVKGESAPTFLNEPGSSFILEEDPDGFLTFSGNTLPPPPPGPEMSFPPPPPPLSTALVSPAANNILLQLQELRSAKKELRIAKRTQRALYPFYYSDGRMHACLMDKRPYYHNNTAFFAHFPKPVFYTADKAYMVTPADAPEIYPKFLAKYQQRVKYKVQKQKRYRKKYTKKSYRKGSYTKKRDYSYAAVKKLYKAPLTKKAWRLNQAFWKKNGNKSNFWDYLYN